MGEKVKSLESLRLESLKFQKNISQLSARSPAYSVVAKNKIGEKVRSREGIRPESSKYQKNLSRFPTRSPAHSVGAKKRKSVSRSITRSLSRVCLILLIGANKFEKGLLGL